MRHHLARPVVGALVAAIGAAGLATAPADASRGATRAGATATPVVDARPAEPDAVLTAPARGARAVERLGDQLDDAARVNHTTARALERLLLEDRTAWVDRGGRLFYVEEPMTAAEVARAETAVEEAAPTAAYPLDQTFSLNSKPGSPRTIYLDFDGATVTGTAWNASGVTSGTHVGWSRDTDASTFNDTERTVVQSVWQRVAEDFAAFDVNVTTQYPGADALERSGSTDSVYGARALISDSTQAQSAICGSGCGGVAYVDVFDYTGSYYQPAWVFPFSLGDGAKAIAEAASHEVGHNLGLNHDGTSTTGYYGGHGAWAPIMGVGYNRPLTQWSQGSYADATNEQDDVAVIQGNGLPARTDEAGSTVLTAAAATPTGTAYISARTDVDVFALGTCSGEVTLAADNAPTSPNLDLEVRLLDATGTVRSAAAPTSGSASQDVTTGTDAALTATVPTGTYYVAVDGGGNGGFAAGQYDDYGSLGAYTVRRTGCTTGTATVPTAPTSVAATAHPTDPSVTVSWLRPLDDGGSGITGYQLTRSDGAAPVLLGSGTTSHLVTGLASGTSYTFTVRAVNAVGTGPSTSVSAATTTPPPPPPSVTPPGAPRIGKPVPGRRGGQTTAKARWAPPSVDGGAPVTGYRIVIYRVGGQGRVRALRAVRVARTGPRSATLSLAPGRYQFAVRALNTAGQGPDSGRSATVVSR